MRFYIPFVIWVEFRFSQVNFQAILSLLLYPRGQRYFRFYSGRLCIIYVLYNVCLCIIVINDKSPRSVKNTLFPHHTSIVTAHYISALLSFKWICWELFRKLPVWLYCKQCSFVPIYSRTLNSSYMGEGYFRSVRAPFWCKATYLT
jgi:hypothetical protein